MLMVRLANMLLGRRVEVNMATIPLTQLLTEQSEPEDLYVLQSIEGDNENVKITPWDSSLRSICGQHLVVPRSAIKEIIKTQQQIQCCGKSLFITKVKFVEHKLLTYDELLKHIRAERLKSKRYQQMPNAKLPAKVVALLSTVLPIMIGDGPPNSWSGGEGGDEGEGNGEGDDGSEGGYDPDCFRNCQVMCSGARNGADYRRCVQACREMCGMMA